MLLDDPDWHIHADVLTKADGLYQGRVVDKVLGNDSELVTITLGDPRRFRRKEYLDAKAAKEHPDPSEFWVSIPTNIFLIMGGEIQTMNIRYVPSTVASLKSPSSDLARGLKELSKLVSALEASASSSIRKD